MKAFVTLLSNESYLKGVIALNRALKEVGSIYPLYCMLSASVKRELVKCLEIEGIPYIFLAQTHFTDNNELKEGNFSHWSNTFDKLQMWGLTQFEKIVFLDSDMLILRNLDSLFDKKPFSAVPAGYSSCLREDWLYLNSGLMVVEPNEKVLQNMLQLAPQVIREFRERNEFVGDQDVIKRYCTNWKEDKELHLDEGYNLFADYLTYYIRKWGYSWNGEKGKPIYVVHFIGKKKPWMKKTLRNWCWIIKTCIINPYYAIAYHKYSNLLK